jgi:hypothetical protein
MGRLDEQSKLDLGLEVAKEQMARASPLALVASESRKRAVGVLLRQVRLVIHLANLVSSNYIDDSHSKYVLGKTARKT